MQLHDASMIQDMERERRNLIVYNMATGTKFLLRASKSSVRDTWLNWTNLLIEEAKRQVSTERSRSSSEPPELSLPHKGHTLHHGGKEREREGPKKKLKRPSSSTGTRESSSTSSPTSPPGERPSKGTTKMVSIS